MALRLGLNPIGFHVGNARLEALRLYSGMGLSEFVVVRIEDDHDIVPALQAGIRDISGEIVFAGAISERPHATGAMPFVLASALGLPLLAEVSELNPSESGWVAEQRLGRGLVRRLRAGPSALITVGLNGPAPRAPAPGLARKTRFLEKRSTEPSFSRVEPERVRATPPPTRALAATADMLSARVVPNANASAATDATTAAQRILQELERAGFRRTPASVR
jgi:electron transfer flavoprotein beta subunit